MYHYDRRDFDTITRTYQRQYIEDSIAGAERHLKGIEESTRSYINACREQLRKIDATEIKQYVFIRRRENWGTKRIELTVGLFRYPDIEDGERLGWVCESEKFKGTERKKAREYAAKLAEEYGCEIREEGF